MKSDLRPIIIWDTETTGLAPKENHLIEIGMMELKCTSPFKNVFTFSSLIYPAGIEKPRAASRIHGITNPMMQDAPVFNEVWSGVKDFVNHISFGRGRPIMVAHNLSFDKRFLEEELRRIGEPLPDWDFACSLRDVANVLWPGQRASLAALAERFDIVNHEAHRALSDVIATSEFLRKADEYLRSDICGKGIEIPTPGCKIREILESAAERRRKQDHWNNRTFIFRNRSELVNISPKRKSDNDSNTCSEMKRASHLESGALDRRCKRLSLSSLELKAQKKNFEPHLQFNETILSTMKSETGVNGVHVFATNRRKVWHRFRNCRALVRADSVMELKIGNIKKNLRICRYCKKRFS